MAYLSTKLAIKDNYEEEDISDDVDDEVFIRDGRNGFKVDEERGVKRPLMAPRRKTKGGNHFHTETCKSPPCTSYFAPCCYGFIALCALLGLIVLITMLINMFPLPFERIREWTVGPPEKSKLIVPCTEISTQDIWVKSFPKLVSEAPIKMADLNGDNVDDVILGYGTGADDIELSGIACEKYFGHPMEKPCMGGVMAMNGLTGETLWQHWTSRSILFVDCSTDINQDKCNDCLISGKGGVIAVLNGKSGETIWTYESDSSEEVSSVNVYTAQFIPDVNYDGVPDVLAAHTANSKTQPAKIEGHLMIFSGKAKSIISKVSTPNGESILDAPQLLVLPDGTDMVVFSTGDIASRGNTYCTNLNNIIKGDIDKNVVLLSANSNSVSPVLVDLNNDGTNDIVTTNGAYVSVYDGRTLHQLWNTSVTSTTMDLLTTYISPTPAYFNDDLVPDILVTQLAGPDILSIYYTQISVLDGRNGQILLERPIIGSGVVDSPAVTISFKGIGNDYLLFWHSVCVGHESDKEPFYLYRDNANVREQSRTDFCRLRFNSSTEMRLYALSQHIEPPGVVIYSTESRWRFEHNDTETEQATQTFMESSSQGVSAFLNNFRRKELPAPNYHRNNHKSRLQYSQQHINGLPYEKTQSSYPYYQDRIGGDVGVQVQWPPGQVAGPQDPNPYLDNYRDNTNNQRLLSPLLGTIGELAQEYDNAYNDDSEELGDLGAPLVADRDRDERESFQRMIATRNQNQQNSVNSKSPASKEAEDVVPNKQQRISKRSTTSDSRRVILPRVTAAVSLAASGNSGVESIDVILATHWVPASQREMVLLTPADLQCIKTRMEQSERVKLQEGELNEDITADCLTARGGLVNNREKMLRIDKGQLTVYRLRIICSCSHLNAESEVCSQPLNYKSQSWPNWGGNSFFKVRRPPY